MVSGYQLDERNNEDENTVIIFTGQILPEAIPKHDDVKKIVDFFSVDELKNINLIGLPILVEHVPGTCCGVITDQCRGVDNTLIITGIVEGNAKNTNFIQNKMKQNSLSELSLTHIYGAGITPDNQFYVHDKIPTEISLCKKARRPNCKILFKKEIFIKKEKYQNIKNTMMKERSGYIYVDRTLQYLEPITSVSASALTLSKPTINNLQTSAMDNNTGQNNINSSNDQKHTTPNSQYPPNQNNSNNNTQRDAQQAYHNTQNVGVKNNNQIREHTQPPNNSNPHSYKFNDNQNTNNDNSGNNNNNVASNDRMDIVNNQEDLQNTPPGAEKDLDYMITLNEKLSTNYDNKIQELESLKNKIKLLEENSTQEKQRRDKDFEQEQLAGIAACSDQGYKIPVEIYKPFLEQISNLDESTKKYCNYLINAAVSASDTKKAEVADIVHTALQLQNQYGSGSNQNVRYTPYTSSKTDRINRLKNTHAFIMRDDAAVIEKNNQQFYPNGTKSTNCNNTKAIVSASNSLQKPKTYETVSAPAQTYSFSSDYNTAFRNYQHRCSQVVPKKKSSNHSSIHSDDDI
ncbi:hypothetical protein EON71_00005 [bacterium]|nr:MAG: hypothetical protein EON71_00005 [bacterium]